MNFGLWTAYGALNSKPVFEAFKKGVLKLGHSFTENKHGDIDVIWSILWKGRMLSNKKIYEYAKTNNKPIIVLEVGGLHRGHTWKLGLNGINRDAYFGKLGNDNTRAKKLNLNLKEWTTSGQNVLIACQHKLSGQWEYENQYIDYLNTTIKNIRKTTDRPIIIRPHPRYRLTNEVSINYKNVLVQQPLKIKNTYDDYDFTLKNIFALFNYSSNPGIHAALQGIPVFVSKTSLAWDVSNKNINQLNNLIYPERNQWLNDLAYTEWTTEEISTGFPILRLTDIM